jgi:hypothetical protein
MYQIPQNQILAALVTSVVVPIPPADLAALGRIVQPSSRPEDKAAIPQPQVPIP